MNDRYVTKISEDVNPLCCAHCGGDFLHHGAVFVRSRTREDEGGIVTVVDGTFATTKPATADEFPGRRDSLSIRFSCELCSKDSWLHIDQHKGQTLVRLSKGST
jgi:hypothetical protein